MTLQRVAVIGSGAAGLAAARRLAESSNIVFTVFEQTATIGGTWVYTDETGIDKYGLPVHTSMYKSLKTNLPKEVMGYPDFPIPPQERSYIPSADILSFLNLFADHFNLRKYIKLNHHVKSVEPLNEKWKLTVLNLPENKECSEEFDAVMVCTGHYHTPLFPMTTGLDTFPGEQIHSHDYRDPIPFTNKKVLVIGAGPSGIDLGIEVASTASEVVLSHHSDVVLNQEVFPKNLYTRPVIKKFEKETAIFEDGTTFAPDILLHCTGYKYSFPFLSPECGVKVENNCVQPLYKHLVHIHKPTLCFVGLPYYVCACSMFDLQVRFFLKSLTGEFQLPSSQDMLLDTQNEIAKRQSSGLKRTQFHMMGPLQGDYYDELAKLANLEPIPPVLAKLHTDASQRQLDDLINFRKDNYEIVDDNTYVQVN